MQTIKEHLLITEKDGHALIVQSVTLNKSEAFGYATHRTSTRVEPDGSIQKLHFWGHYHPNLHEAELDFIQRIKS